MQLQGGVSDGSVPDVVSGHKASGLEDCALR